MSAPVAWDELPDVEMEDFTIATMPARFAELGDLHAGIDDAVCDLRVLLEWVEREEAQGEGEAPYPPNFPKMPGEPKRVQPSRAKKRVAGRDRGRRAAPRRTHQTSKQRRERHRRRDRTAYVMRKPAPSIA